MGFLDRKYKRMHLSSGQVLTVEADDSNLGQTLTVFYSGKGMGDAGKNFKQTSATITVVDYRDDGSQVPFDVVIPHIVAIEPLSGEWHRQRWALEKEWEAAERQERQEREQEAQEQWDETKQQLAAAAKEFKLGWGRRRAKGDNDSAVDEQKDNAE